MNFSDVFIRRPVATTLIMLAILLFGVVAYRSLPVSDLPNVDFPTIRVDAGLPGASPETMAAVGRDAARAAVLDDRGPRLDDLELGARLDLHHAAVQPHARPRRRGAGRPGRHRGGRPAAAARHADAADLPEGNPADSPILYLALTSTTLPLSTLDEFGQTMMAQRISTVPGVAQVQVYGSQKYAVRIQLDPRELAARGIGIDEVAQPCATATSTCRPGTLYGKHQSFTVEADGQLTRAEAYGPLIVAYRNGAPVRLRDIGRSHRQRRERQDRRPGSSRPRAPRARSCSPSRSSPGTNTVESSTAIRAALPAFQKQLPAAATLRVAVRPLDRRSASPSTTSSSRCF